MGKKLSSIMKVLAIVLCLVSFAMTTNAQKKKTTRKTTAPKTTPASTASANAAELKIAAEKVSTQIKNVSKFVYLLGGIARSLEDADKEAKAKRLPPNAPDPNARNKQALIQSIQNLRAGLVALENEFNTKPALRLYSVRFSGISNMVMQSESQAAGGQFTESGKTLLLVIERLSDALAALP